VISQPMAHYTALSERFERLTLRPEARCGLGLATQSQPKSPLLPRQQRIPRFGNTGSSYSVCPPGKRFLRVFFRWRRKKIRANVSFTESAGGEERQMCPRAQKSLQGSRVSHGLDGACGDAKQSFSPKTPL